MGVVTALAIGAIATGVGTAVQASAANKQAKAAGKRASAAAREVEALKASRQEIINPYESVEDLSGLAKDLSGMMSNPFESLGVATKSAEIQMEQTDMALANTLDTLRMTGASAGGATALAQAALASKKGVAANIEQQEAQNEKLRAQGEQQLNQMKIAEQQRLQGVAIAEGQRLQQAEIAGQQFMFQTQENRTNADLDRAAGIQTQQQNLQAQSQANQTAAIAGGMSALGSLAMAGATIGAAPTGTIGSAGSVGSVTAGGAVPVGGGGLAGSGTLMPGSDRRLKKNIKLLGYSPSGLNIYAFEYINKKFGEGVFQGVMSDEIPSKAVVKHEDGFDRVDYSKIDVEFKQI